MISYFQTGGLYRLMVLACVFVAGCHQKPEEVPAVNFEIPQQFTTDGFVWQLKEMGPKEIEVLSRFFKSHQSLSDSPEFEGDPSVFVSKKNVHRFYWLHPSADGPLWRSVQVSGRKSIILEGTGNPFE